MKLRKGHPTGLSIQGDECIDENIKGGAFANGHPVGSFMLAGFTYLVFAKPKLEDHLWSYEFGMSITDNQNTGSNNKYQVTALDFQLGLYNSKA